MIVSENKITIKIKRIFKTVRFFLYYTFFFKSLTKKAKREESKDGEKTFFLNVNVTNHLSSLYVVNP